MALDARSVDVNRVMRFLANAPGNGANFITGRTMNQVGKSRYGRKAVQNMTRDIRDARSLNSVSGTSGLYVGSACLMNIVVDTERIARLNNELNEIRQDMENGDTEIGPLKDKLADISAEEKDIYARSVCLNMSKWVMSNCCSERHQSASEEDCRRGLET